MKFKLTAILLLGMALTACSQESKVRNAVQEQLKTELTAKLDKEFKGTEKSKVFNELRSLIESKTKVEVTQVAVNGDKAEGKILVTTLSQKETGGLMLIMMFAGSELDKKGSGLSDVLTELRAKDKRVPALADFPTEQIEVSFTATKGETWKLTDSKKVTKKN